MQMAIVMVYKCNNTGDKKMKKLILTIGLIFTSTSVFAGVVTKVDDNTITISKTIVKSETKTITQLKEKKTRLEAELEATYIRNQSIIDNLNSLIDEVDTEIADAEELGVTEIKEVAEKDIVEKEISIEEASK